MSATSTLTSVHDAAHDYIERGWHIVAVQPKKKAPHFRYAPHGYLSATDSHANIDDWFSKNPRLNIGIAARQSGLVIIDLDHRNFDRRSCDLEALLAEQHPTYTVRTGNGWHLYYDAGDDFTAEMGPPGDLGAGIDVRFNGYAVAAPSTHATGAVYTCTADRTPAPFPLHLLYGDVA